MIDKITKQKMGKNAFGQQELTVNKNLPTFIEHSTPHHTHSF